MVDCILAGNIYLSSTFGLADDWASTDVLTGRCRCTNTAANFYLEEHSDRPVLMMLPHGACAYTEPSSYRYLFAGDPQKRPKMFSRCIQPFSGAQGNSKVRREEQAQERYVRDRYDNNLRYIDDSLTPFLDHFPILTAFSLCRSW